MPLFTGGAYVVADASRLLTYDPFWKVHPPLRSSLDRNSLVAAVGRGDIGVSSFDFRASSEDKLREWSSAAVGQAVIEHMPSLVWQAVRDACVGKWDPPRFASLLSEKPRRLLGLPAPVLREGHPLDLTFFRIEREPFQLPPPWEGFSSTLKVLGVIRCLDDVRNLRIQMS
ncbi:MAG: hypothetical protein N2170_02515 [Bacteroidia bacterium]|nr:hypothetical protein [Bacteroidia bacterium]